MVASLLRAALCLALLCHAAQAQPLPQDACFDVDPKGNSCGRFRLSGLGGSDLVTASLGLRTKSGQVLIYWRARKGSAAPTRRLQAVETPYRPTAVTRHAGQSNSFYVAGWFDRLGLAIVERWTVAQAALGQTLGPSGQSLTAFTEPTLAKEVVYISPAAGADPVIRGLACHPFAETLWLLTNEPSRRLLEVSVTEAALQDPGTNQPSEVLSATQHAYMDGANSIKALFSETGGLVLLVQERLHWVSCLKEPYYMQRMMPEAAGTPSLPEPEVLLLVDDDLDGQLLPPTVLTDSAFVDTYRGSWNPDFSVP